MNVESQKPPEAESSAETPRVVATRFIEQANITDPKIKQLLLEKVIHRLSEAEEQELERYATENNITLPVDFVGPGKISHHETLPGGQNQLLVAKELNGCMAVLIYSETADGRRRSILSHQPPDLVSDEYYQRLKELVDADSVDAVKMHAVIYANKRRGERVATETASWLQKNGNGKIVTDEPTYYQTSKQDSDMGLFMATVPAENEQSANFSALRIPRSEVLS